MARYKVIYENLAGQTKVEIVNAKTPEEAEDYILCHLPDCMQVIYINKQS